MIGAITTESAAPTVPGCGSDCPARVRRLCGAIIFAARATAGSAPSGLALESAGRGAGSALTSTFTAATRHSRPR